MKVINDVYLLFTYLGRNTICAVSYVLSKDPGSILCYLRPSTILCAAASAGKQHRPAEAQCVGTFRNS